MNKKIISIFVFFISVFFYSGSAFSVVPNCTPSYSNPVIACTNMVIGNQPGITVASNGSTTYSCKMGGVVQGSIVCTSGYTDSLAAAGCNGTYYADTSTCSPNPDPVCTGATHLENHICVPDPVCTGATHLENHVCVADPVCTGETHLENHVCVADPVDPVCTGSTHLVNHVCVADPVCTGSTHLENHVCVPNTPTDCGYLSYRFPTATEACRAQNAYTSYGSSSVAVFGASSDPMIFQCSTPTINSGGGRCYSAADTGHVTCPDGSTAATVSECPTTVCKPPETLNQFGLCSVKECVNGTVLNVATGICQAPPNCSSFEIYDNPSNTCNVKKLQCPLHSHANASNDQCLADPPLGCPLGQHDNGSYKCVADDAVGCKPGYQKGYIFGIAQCIKKHEQHEAAAKHDTASKDRDDAEQRYRDAQAANDAAAAAAAADPENPEKQAAAASAAGELTAAKANKDDKQAAVDKAKSEADTAALKAIADNTQEANDIQNGKDASLGDRCSSPPQCSGDPVNCTILLQQWHLQCDGSDTSLTDDEVTDVIGTSPDLSDQTVDLSAGSSAIGLDHSGYGLPSTCPAPITANVLNKTLSIDVSPFCDIAEIIGYLIMITAYFISLRIIASPN